jgi:hypothetical protein
MAVKSLHQIFYYHSKYLNSMKVTNITIMLDQYPNQGQYIPTTMLRIF